MSEIKPLREKISELESAGKERDKKLDRIIFLLDNDEGTGSKGLVARVQDLHKGHADVNAKIDNHINNYETDKKVQTAKTMKWGGVIGAVAASIVTAVFKLFNSN